MRFTDIEPLSVVEFDCLMIAVPVSKQDSLAILWW